ncbi:MAG: hypothetical protein HXX16_01190 [Bacteroidales bacterium]|nr:hypothetical protein [Bacteroidales bacterium]
MRLPNISTKKLNIIISVIIFVLSFLKFEPYFTTGLDSPYMWALNHLFINDFDFLRHLVFPIGILGFLKHPIVVGNNVLIAVLFFSLIKLAFLFLLLELGQSTNKWIKAINILVTLIVSYFVTIDIAIIGGCAISLLIFSGNKKFILFIWAILLASIGLFIKSSIGINAFSVIFVYIVYDYSINRSVRQILILIFSATLSVFFIGMILYQSIPLLINYFWGIFKMMEGYPSLALSPDNNWYLLSLFIISIFSIPFLFKERITRFAFLLLLFPLFFMWKHAMSREDASHYSLIVSFTIIFWSILFFTIQKIRPIHILIPILGIASLFANYRNTENFNGYRIDLAGYKNFTEVFFNYNGLIEKQKEVSIKNISKNILPDEIRKEIGDSTIDVYPWDLSYIPANNLKWKPRTTLQSGAFSSWLDKKSASNFRRNNGADYIIFQLIDDGNYGKLGSLDGRYILNDEPNSILTIFNNYSIVNKTDKFLLFKKGTANNLLSPKEIFTDTVKWDEWVDVPKITNAIIRAKFLCKGTNFGAIKSFLYKGETLYIDYLLDNGRMLSYRFVESNAQDGLWVNPLIQNPLNNEIEPTVEKVKLRCSNPRFYNKESIIHWERIDISHKISDSQSNQDAYSLFNKLVKSQETIIKQKMFDFEQKDSTTFSSLTDAYSYSGKYSNIVPANGFSYTYSVHLDSLWKDTLNALSVEADVWYRSPNVRTAILVISLENSENSDFWEPRKLSIASKEWNSAFIIKRLSKEIHKKGLLKVYVYNPDKTHGEIYIDNLRVSFKKEE